MNVLPYGTRQIFSFIGHRHNGCKPLEDYRRLSNRLGSSWWAEKRRTHKGYLATRHVLDGAVKIDAPLHTIIPKEHFLPAVKKTDLSTLKLTKSDLGFDGIQKRIKRAYWIQAKSHHPDMGGDIQAFRKLQTAYEKLMEWSRKPRFVSFTGFPDKWLYEGGINRWNQPARFSLTHE
jgi:hypothetical protein